MTYKIYGGLGSPYSMKVRAVCRYRRLPHQWVQLDEGNDAVRTSVKVPVIPIVIYPDETAHNDSTPLIHDLEARHPGQRSVIPPDPADAFLSDLLEDMADEWGTKFMFHYRWFLPRDQAMLGKWLAFDRYGGEGRQRIEDYGQAFRDRQVGRMALVGCTPQNQALIEGAFHEFLAIFERQVVEQRYLFGSRPSLADFGWYGELSQLIVDPTPADLMREHAPYAMRWTMQMEDASGIEGAWRDDGQWSDGVKALIAYAGRFYLPFLLANAEALARGEAQFGFSVDGDRYEQGTFKYQARCLQTLRERYAALPAAAKDRLAPLLRDCGLEGLTTSA